MNRFTLRSPAHPTRRYCLEGDWTSCRDNVLDPHLVWHDTLGDGETQHTTNGQVLATAENLLDFAAAAAAWFSQPHEEEQEERFIYVFHYLRKQPAHVEFCAALKYDENNPKRQYFSLDDTDRNGKPRKSTDPNKRYDKRWHEVTAYNASNGQPTAEKVYRALYDGEEIGQYWDALQSWHAYEQIREQLRESTGNYQTHTAEFFKLDELPQFSYALHTLALIVQSIDNRRRIRNAAQSLAPRPQDLAEVA